jgi:hypothetical protein
LNETPDLIDNQNDFQSNPSYIVPDEQVDFSTNSTYHTNQESTPIANTSSTSGFNKSNIFQIGFYHQYFDLDSDIFFVKVQRALNPLTGEFENENENDNELYGFFWITGTLIFLMFVSSTGSNLLLEWIHSSEGEKYNYSFDLIFTSIILFYSYNLIVPGILYVYTTMTLKFPHKLRLTKIVSIYGYTNILWFPITLINFFIVVLINNDSHHILLNIIEWVIVLSSGAITGLSNLKKISPKVQENCLLLSNGDGQLANKQYWKIIVGLIIAHLVFTIMVKICYFGVVV